MDVLAAKCAPAIGSGGAGEGADAALVEAASVVCAGGATGCLVS
jgi:hypothetical protein